VFTVIRSIEEEPDSAPAASPRLRRSPSPWPPQARVSPTQEVRRPTSTPGSTTHRSRPISVRFEPVKRCGTLRHRFLAYSSRSRSPDPHHLTVLTHPGLVGAAPTLPGTSRIRLPPASARPLRRPDGTGLSPPLKSQRRTAHEAGTQCVRDHLQRPDHSDWQLTNARIRSTVYLTAPSARKLSVVTESEASLCSDAVPQKA